MDEFVFRFNRCKSKSRGLLFYRLLQNAVIIPKQNYELIVLPAPAGREAARRSQGASLQHNRDHKYARCEGDQGRGGKSRASPSQQNNG